MTRSFMTGVAALAAAGAFGAATPANPSFEETGADGTVPGWSSTRKLMRAERGAGHNGSGGLVWESAEPSRSRGSCVQDLALESGLAYRFSCLVRTEKFKCPRGGAVICLEWYDANGKWMSGGYTHGLRDANLDWTLVEGATRAIPVEAKSFKLQIYVPDGATGRVCFDNVSVAPLNQNPVAFVCSSVYRDVAADGPVKFHAALFPSKKHAVEDLEAFFTRRNAKGETVRVQVPLASADAATLACDVSDLPMGTSAVTCELFLKGGAKLGESSLEFTRAAELPKRRVWIDGHGRCIVDGKPFFPHGMYAGKVSRDYIRTYATGPFNVIMPYSRTTPADLDLLQEFGIMAFVNLKNETLHSPWARYRKITKQEEVDAFFVEQINRAKNHPAVLAWYVNDESPVTEVPERTHLYQIFRRLDPDHPTWAVLDRLYDLREFMPTYDVLGMDPYPVAQKPLTHITDFIRGTHRAVFSSRVLWNVPQAFNWGWYRKDKAELERFPTEQELRNMNWQHIALGANGLVSYCYHAYFRDVSKPDFDKYWGPVCRVGGEVKSRIPVLLSVEPAPAASGAPEYMPVRTWVKDGALYLLAVNATNAPLAGEIALSCGEWKDPAADFGTPATLRGPRTVALDLPALGVSITRFTAAK